MENKNITESIQKLKEAIRNWYSKVSVNEICNNKRLMKEIHELEVMLLQLGGQFGK
jgi:hypothetical protein